MDGSGGERRAVLAINVDLKLEGGTLSAMIVWGLKDTSSRPAKDLGGTLQRTIRTTLRSYDIRASGDRECPHRQGCVANVAKANFKFKRAASGYRKQQQVIIQMQFSFQS